MDGGGGGGGVDEYDRSGVGASLHGSSLQIS